MLNTSVALLSTSYLPPIQYISKFLFHDKIYIERHENFQKQSFRNRCIIYAANGPLTMVIPVTKEQGVKTRISDIRIDNNKSWQKLHWKSIISAYKNSPYFDFFEDQFVHFYEKQQLFLCDFNMRLLVTLLEMIEIDNLPQFTEKYSFSGHFEDYRQSINPKKRLARQDEYFEPVRYHQVFEDKYGFIPNLSIIDLIFNEGPNTLNLLASSIKKGI